MKVQLLMSAAVVALAPCGGGTAVAQIIPTQPAATSSQGEVPASTSAPAARPSASLQDGQLADIIVTAQRRSENLQRAAIAVTAVGGEALVRAGVSDAVQLTRIAPALQISNAFGPTNAFYLRGVGNFVTNTLSDPAIAFNLDGVNIARPTAAQGVFYDLERIEVLKGPQGTLYGRNATGGAINVITAKPVFGEFSGFGTVEIGNYDTRKLVGAVNIPMGDKGAMRIAGQLSRRDGWYSDGTGDERSEAIRVSFASRLTDTLRVTVGGDFAHQGGIGSGATVYGLDPNDRIGLFDPRAQAIIASSFSFLAGNTLNRLATDSYNNNKFWGMYAQADLTTELGTLTVIPAYRRSDLHYRNYASGFGITEDADQEQTSIEARFASDGDRRLAYMVGLFYMNETISEKVGYGQQYFAPYSDFKPTTNSYAGFGRLTFKVTDAFRLTGGIRYTKDDKSADISSINAVVVCPGVFVPAPNGPRFCPNTPALPSVSVPPSFLFTPAGTIIPVQPYGPSGAIVQTTSNPLMPSRTFRKATYRAGFEFDVAPRSLVYGTFETGFKSGGFFQSVDTPVFQPETITAFTLGSKNRFLDNRLQINIEAYRWTYKDQQVSHFRTNSVGGTEFVTENIGKTRLQGIEVEAQARVRSGTTLNLTAQYLDAVNKNFTYSNPASLGAPVTGCAVRGPTAGAFTVDCSGFRPTQAPEWTVTGGIEQVIPLGQFGKLTLNAQSRYQSESYTGFDLLPSQVQKGYFMTDLQASVAVQSGFTFSVFVNNVENNNVVAFSQPHPRAPSLLIRTLRAPRMYGVRAGFKF